MRNKCRTVHSLNRKFEQTNVMDSGQRFSWNFDPVTGVRTGVPEFAGWKGETSDISSSCTMEISTKYILPREIVVAFTGGNRDNDLFYDFSLNAIAVRRKNTAI